MCKVGLQLDPLCSKILKFFCVGWHDSMNNKHLFSADLLVEFMLMHYMKESVLKDCRGEI
jgi:hypothetical protein